jgi:hypothetical protein
MEERKARRPVMWIAMAILSGGLLTVLLFVLSTGVSVAQEGVTYDTLCMDDAYEKKTVCTAKDFGITAIEFVEVVDRCEFEGDTAEVRVLLTAAVGEPERYDIGYFIALSGTNAIDPGNTCYHSFLQPVYTGTVPYSPTSGVGPFYQGDEVVDDMCGDSEGNNVDLRFVTPDLITIECKDSPDDPDNNVDVQVCASYKQANDSACTSISGPTGAVPGAPSKCACTTFNFPFTPTGITLGEISASETNRWLLPIVGVLLILAATTIVVLRKRIAAEEIV